jgi:hypothetical protein
MKKILLLLCFISFVAFSQQKVRHVKVHRTYASKKDSTHYQRIGADTVNVFSRDTVINEQKCKIHNYQKVHKK